jgi:hypothetical protein
MRLIVGGGRGGSYDTRGDGLIQMVYRTTQRPLSNYPRNNPAGLSVAYPYVLILCAPFIIVVYFTPPFAAFETHAKLHPTCFTLCLSDFL